MTNTRTEQLEWRRNKVQELAVKGFKQSEIVQMLQVDKSAVCRDIAYLKDESIKTIKDHIQDRLPYEYNKCLQGLEEIIKEGWLIATKADKTGDTKEKLQSLALIKDTYSTKMDLLTNASLLQDSLKFVTETKENLSNKKENIEHSDIQGPAEDYSDTESTTTINQVF